MNLLDIIILLLIVIFGIVGCKRGVFKQIVMFCGIFIVFILAYKFKNIIGDFLILRFPFFDFPNFLKGAITLNILMYQAVSFLVTFGLLLAIYNLIVLITGIFEKLLKITIILGIPSRILGFIVGLIEGVMIVYILLFIITQPALKFKYVDESKYARIILKKTPIVSNVMKNSVELVSDIDKLTVITDVNKLNLEIIDLILEKDITSVDVIEKLIAKEKIRINGIDSIIKKYK